MLVLLSLLHAFLGYRLHEEILGGDGTQCQKPTSGAEETINLSILKVQ